MQKDRRLRLFCLTVKADIDGEMQSSAAKRDWEEIFKLANDLGDRRWQYRATAGLGLAAFYSGDLVTARQNIGAALIAATANRDVGAQVLYLYAAGYGLFATKMYEQALPLLDKAIALAVSTPDAGYPYMVYIAKADSLSAMGQVDEARKVVASTQQAARHRNAPVYEANTLVSLAKIDRATGDHAKAVAELEHAVSICKTGGFVRNLVESELILADVYREQHNLQNAQRVLSDAIRGSQRNGDLSTLADRLRILAGIEAARGNILAADRTYDRAAIFVDTAIASDSTIIDKTAWVTSASQLYVEHFSLIADHKGDPSKLFAIVEQVRGRVTTDALLGGSVTGEKAEAVEAAISKGRLALMNAKNSTEVSRIRDQMFLLQQARWITPDVKILRSPTNRRVTLADVQQKMSPETVLLEYVLASPKSYCLVITRDAARVIPIAAKDQIESAGADYLTVLRSRRSLSHEPERLYELLLAPLGNLMQKKNVIIVRDGVLHMLPFDCLRAPDRQFMVQSHTVSYLPSAGTFALLASKNAGSHPTGSLFAVGGVPYRQQSIQLASAQPTRNNVLENIPNSAEEIKAASKAFNDQKTTLLTGTAATKSAIQKAPLGDYRVLHFAVHGLADPKRPDQSALIFLNDSKSEQDALLTAAEITRLHISADMVVLSACDTAVGRVEGQEGIDTLARSFLLAGARSVVSSLWSLDDNFSLALLKLFYGSYSGTGDAAVSLASAKRSILARFGNDLSPYYWAALTFEGVPASAIAHHVTNR